MDFNRYSSTYRSEVDKSLSGLGADSDHILKVKADHFIQTLRDHFKTGLESLNVLDVGCGIGLMDQFWNSTLPRLQGIDISSDSIKIAQQNNPGLVYQTYNGKAIPYENNSFDALVLVCVLHHVPEEEWQGFFNELHRVVKPGGLISVYEHNPYNPITQWIVSRCEFDDDAVLLTPQKTKKLAKNTKLSVQLLYSILFFPWRAQVFRKIERWIRWIPLGAQYVAVFKKENE